MGFGATVHIPAFQSEDLDVVAVCARREERATEAAQRFGISKTFTDYRKMLQMDGLDAVSIVSPVANHYQMTMEASTLESTSSAKSPSRSINLRPARRGRRPRMPDSQA